MSSTGEQPGGADKGERPSSSSERTDSGGLIITYNDRPAEFNKGVREFLDLLGASESGSIDLEEFTEALALALEMPDPWESGYARQVREVFVDGVNEVTQSAWAMPLLEVGFSGGQAVVQPESYIAHEILAEIYPDFPPAPLATE